MARWFGALALLVGLSASAAPFSPLPADKSGEAPGGLQARVVRYNGNTNGKMTVEVRNPTGAPLQFVASGLYFVPGGNPDQAPQRLGAVGAYEANGARHERLVITPGQTVQAELDVYCIDSHRASPSSSTPFGIARDRMPAKLRSAIDEEAKSVSAPTGGVNAPESKPAVQGAVWRSRDKKWIKLQGESAQEADKR